MLRLRALALTCTLIPASALAAPNSQVLALRQEIAALQLDHTLNLSKQQAQALLPEIQEAKAKVEAFKSQMTASEPARVAALTQAVADLKATGTISDSTAQALQAAGPGSAGTLRQNLKSFWEQARQVLNSSQLQSLKTVRLGAGQPPSGADMGTPGRGPGGHGHFAHRFFVLHTFLSDAFVSLLQARAA